MVDDIIVYRFVQGPITSPIASTNQNIVSFFSYTFSYYCTN